MQTIHLDQAVEVKAPDGSTVRILSALDRGSMAHFSLAPGRISKAVYHQTVDEIWFITNGLGQMWQQDPDDRQQVIDLKPGLSLTIPCGTKFQFRSSGNDDLEAVAITMPPWPGEDEAVFADGLWTDQTAG